ncbi:hypothetical protein CsSME_00049938 [Camellia sinensis var. sinensis]
MFEPWIIAKCPCRSELGFKNQFFSRSTMRGRRGLRTVVVVVESRGRLLVGLGLLVVVRIWGLVVCGILGRWLVRVLRDVWVAVLKLMV